MSFGFGVGDFLAVGQLCWKVYKKCKDSPGYYAELTTEVGSLQNVIKETEELLSQQGLTTEQNVKLTTCRQGCEGVLKDLDGLLVKYESLGTNSRRTFDRMGFGMQDMNSIRLRLISNVSMLDAFNNAASYAKLENKLNLLIAEVRAGKREGSVISTKTFDASAQNDRETWDALRRELEDIGISPGVITEKRHFIIAWFQEAVAAGRLEEDAPSDYDDDDGAISLYESDGPAGNSDSDSVPEGEMSSMLIESCTTEGNTVEGSLPKAPRSSRQPSEVVYSRRHPPSSPLPQQRKRNSGVRVSYLLNKLRGIDKRFLYAAMDGDVPKTKELLEKGAGIEYKASRGPTALMWAAHNGHEAVVRLLLEKGADIESKNLYGHTALNFAAERGHESMVRLLLKKGADIGSNISGIYTALTSAAERGDASVVRLLLEEGVDIEHKKSFGDTALILAALEGHEAVVRLLLEKGADFDYINLDVVDTALIYATRKGHVSVVRLLLEKGAVINTKDQWGRTALYYAETHRDKTIAQLLRDAGAKVE